jgi:hypothetical protein
MSDVRVASALMLQILVGTIAAIVGYVLGRKLLDFICLKSHFTGRIWHNTISQLGELFLLVLVICFVLIASLLFNLIQNALGLGDQ